jgi:hypothetical protein
MRQIHFSLIVLKWWTMVVRMRVMLKWRKAVVEIPPEPCPLCVLVPCDWVTFGEEICEECNAVAEQKVPNKEICFHAYRMYTHFRFGVLCQYDQRPLPVCVCREIMDAHPDPNHQYVGFQAAIRDVCVIVVSFINQ